MRSQDFLFANPRMRAECRELRGGESSDPHHEERETESKHHSCKVAVVKVSFAGPTLSGYIKSCPGESKPGTCENFNLRSYLTIHTLDVSRIIILLNA